VAASTHSLTFTADRVVKRYRSWDRGEPDREWSGLGLLHQHAPGASPQPLRRCAEDGAPVIEMTRVAGEPLGTAKLSPAQVDALAHTLTRLYWAAPGEALARQPEPLGVGRRPTRELPALLRGWVHGSPPVTCPPAAGLSRSQRARLRGFRRLMAVYWLLMLLPGNPAHQRNPPGSLERQAAHVCRLL
jgi:hypothetical protein